MSDQNEKNPPEGSVDLPRFVRHIAGLREKAQKLEDQCCSQGDYEQYESRISSLLEEADELQSMILPNVPAVAPPTLDSALPKDVPGACYRRLVRGWWRFVGTFRDWRADWVEIQVALLSYHVAVACEMPETAEM